MITNERQYRITKKQAEKFRQALRDFNEISLIKEGIDPIIVAAQRASIAEQLTELERDITRYEDLQSGEEDTLIAEQIVQLGEKLIEARIAQGLSQRELADRLGMKEQQVQRYEQERYKSANLGRVSEVAQALRLNFQGAIIIIGSSVTSRESSDQFDPARLPAKEMRKRGWFDDETHVPFELASDTEIAAAYVQRAFRGPEPMALHKQTIRGKGRANRYALLAWKARVLQKARKMLGDGPREFPIFDAIFVKQLAELSRVQDGPVLAVKRLREKGVAVVFEERLQSMALDGAAMLLDGSTPVIGLTLRHDRFDNFWFVLMHELAHIICHRDKGLKDGFFDDDSAVPHERVEQEADEYAQNALIPQEVWSNSFVRYTKSKEEVVAFASKHKIAPSIVGGRIRRERNDYAIFSDLVGQGKLKRLIKESGLLEG